MQTVLQFIKSMNTVDYVFSVLCLIYIIYKTIDPKSHHPLSSPIGRFFKAIIMVVLFSFLYGFIIGTIMPFIGLNFVQSAFLK